MNPFILPAIGLNSITAVFLEGWLWHEITHEGWYAIKNQRKKEKNFIKILRNINRQGQVGLFLALEENLASCTRRLSGKYDIW